MVITCFILHQMLRINISIAIVDMGKSGDTNESLSNSERFFWTEKEKGHIIGAYFWGQLLMALPAGRLSEIYGTRLVLGSAMFLAGILTIIIPLVAHFSYYLLLLTRVGLGLALGAINPAIPPLAIRWTGPTGISKFLSHTRAVYLGGALTLPACGFLIANWGWRSVFYVTGGIALIWTYFWFLLVYNSPEQHPRISEEEKNVINAKLCTNFTRKTIPWSKILTSVPVHVLVIVCGSYLMTVNMAYNYLPYFMDTVLHFNIQENGLLGSLPYLASYGSAVGCCYIADKWFKTKTYPTLTIRRFFMVVCLGGSVLVFGILCFWGDCSTVAVIVFVVWFTCHGCSTPSISANTIDVAPAYGGTVSGLMYTFGSLLSYVETVVIGLITEDNHTLEQWRCVFGLLIGANLLGLLIFLLFGTTETQSWNFDKRKVETVETADGDLETGGLV
ncbi:hypothetical protein Zmor_016262 [Zophobas morio]|uniref:Major facilitator superfamily (MFS) profile domain-containing protein n=2 Tax=Zophobas morio TaxID=2755281 RepID=A0AA38IJI6_9CUCU|nr:hypothetical protein Zmor_016262 [Zophobas morio]